jgi:hypothetical protein
VQLADGIEPLRAEAGGAGGVEGVAAALRLHWRTVRFSVFPSCKLLLQFPP